MVAYTNHENMVIAWDTIIMLALFTVFKISWDLCKKYFSCNQEYLFQFSNPGDPHSSSEYMST